MKKSVLLLTLLFIFYFGKAQYYYNDVVDLKASNNLYSNLIRNNVQQVSATNTGNDNKPATGFAYSKTIKNNGLLVVTHTELETAGISDDYDTYKNGLLAKSSNNADKVLATVEYTYNNNGNILLVRTQTDDTAMNVHSVEEHKWFYTANVPDSMLKIKDGADTTVVRFKKDENQNVIEELWTKRNRVIEHYYYYYNDKNKLTDIVRFNNKAQQLLPDFLFEYDENGRVAQLTQIPQGSSDYVIWQYVYDNRGLKVKDVLFDKHKELLGTINYTYQ